MMSEWKQPNKWSQVVNELLRGDGVVVVETNEVIKVNDANWVA